MVTVRLLCSSKDLSQRQGVLLNLAQLQLFSEYSASRYLRVDSEIAGERSSLHCEIVEDAWHARNKPGRDLLFYRCDRLSLVVQIDALVVSVATSPGRVSCPSLKLSCQNESETIA